ncbi:MAG: methyltransferase domain-containing protein [Bacteroidales bacterium]|nr:methyltransferase domain-containing protein [Bacteroidales bacterium]
MILSDFKYYLNSSYRRQILDKLLKKYEYIYKGIVLDIGGRDRGRFKKPKNKVEKWIFADIEPKHNPDIVLDVANMQNIETESIDIVNAIELFEHVEKINEGINECFRILKTGGKLILSVPFLFPVHADPYDFQRWTITKWEKELTKAGFKIEKTEIMGRFFTVKNGMNKTLIQSLPIIIRHIGYLLFPIFSLLNKLDNTNWVKNHPKLVNYHGGYFIIAEK